MTDGHAGRFCEKITLPPPPPPPPPQSKQVNLKVNARSNVRIKRGSCCLSNCRLERRLPAGAGAGAGAGPLGGAVTACLPPPPLPPGCGDAAAGHLTLSVRAAGGPRQRPVIRCATGRRTRHGAAATGRDVGGPAIMAPSPTASRADGHRVRRRQLPTARGMSPSWRPPQPEPVLRYRRRQLPTARGMSLC